MPGAFLWSSKEGRALVCRILESTPFPYTPHDDQLEGACKSLDGVHLFAITPTGSGKTSYYTIYILVVLAVVADPSLCPSATFPTNPCLLASHMKTLGLDVLAINSKTRSDAKRRDDEELWVTARSKPNVILSGPEQLKSSEFEKALRDKNFYSRICGTGFDEVHLLNSWGASFRKDFQHMGFVHARMDERHNPWLLTSATVRDGAPFDNICRLLGLNKNFHLIRRSSFRPDIRILFRDLVSPISGDSFPELDFVLDENRPSIIYTKFISLGFRVYAHLLRRAKLTVHSNRIRMYNSMNFDSYNAETRELMKKEPNDPDYCQIIIGTDTLSVGVAMRGRVDAIIIGDVEDTDELLQKLGRVNRDKKADDARAIVFVSAAARKQAEKSIADHEAGISKPGATPLDLSMPRLIVAKCKVNEQNLLYDNPASDPHCTCPTCPDQLPPFQRPSCNCSGCTPEILPTLKPVARASKLNPDIRKADRLSRLQKAHGTKHLVDLRLEIWRNSDPSKMWMFPPAYFLSDSLIASILDNFNLLKNVQVIARIIKPPLHLTAYLPRLLSVLEELKPQFRHIAAERKAENAANRVQRKAAANLAPNDEEGESDSDIVMSDGEVPARPLQ
ncbi:hypothetical protein B0H16DRAFT_1300097 [Mycena metata]|uniref:DNA 3'-5' helicase n=1 Tax=Mycena metata TaxID=1033252 RepID=A0AAD7NY96_9AGAR|nr:hypothetical protein B0H16DRAFT_1300097 [Mycena metata]